MLSKFSMDMKRHILRLALLGNLWGHKRGKEEEGGYFAQLGISPFG
jgi:hypothetical protein